MHANMIEEFLFLLYKYAQTCKITHLTISSSLHSLYYIKYINAYTLSKQRRPQFSINKLRVYFTLQLHTTVKKNTSVYFVQFCSRKQKNSSVSSIYINLNYCVWQKEYTLYTYSTLCHQQDPTKRHFLSGVLLVWIEFNLLLNWLPF